MTTRKYSIDKVRDIVEAEGLGYAIEAYLHWEKIENENLREAWKRAYEAMETIKTILTPY